MKSERRAHKKAKSYINKIKKKVRDRNTQINKLRGSKPIIEYEHDGRQSELAIKYRVSYHAGKRFLERIFNESEPNYKRIVRAVKMIQKALAFELSNKVNGIVPFMDDYVAIIHNDIVVTIRHKDDDEKMKNLTEFVKIEDKQMKEV